MVARAGVLGVHRAGERGREEPLLVSRRALRGWLRRLGDKRVGVDDGPPARSLRLVEREIGLADEPVGAPGIRGLGDAAGEADTAGMSRRLTVKALRKRVRAPRRLVWQQHHQLVAADAVAR